MYPSCQRATSKPGQMLKSQMAYFYVRPRRADKPGRRRAIPTGSQSSKIAQTTAKPCPTSMADSATPNAATSRWLRSPGMMAVQSKRGVTWISCKRAAAESQYEEGNKFSRGGKPHFRSQVDESTPKPKRVPAVQRSRSHHTSTVSMACRSNSRWVGNDALGSVCRSRAIALTAFSMRSSCSDSVRPDGFLAFCNDAPTVRVPDAVRGPRLRSRVASRRRRQVPCSCVRSPSRRPASRVAVAVRAGPRLRLAVALCHVGCHAAVPTASASRKRPSMASNTRSRSSSCLTALRSHRPRCVLLEQCNASHRPRCRRTSCRGTCRNAVAT